MHVNGIWMENLNVKVLKNISVIVGDEKPSGVFKWGSRRNEQLAWHMAGT